MLQHLHGVNGKLALPTSSIPAYQHQSILTDLPSQESNIGPLGEKGTNE